MDTETIRERVQWLKDEVSIIEEWLVDEGLASGTKPGEIDDAKHAKMRETVAELDDETLIFVMLGLLAADTGNGAPLYGGQTAFGGLTTRIVFGEIALRWLPMDVYGDAFRRLMEKDEPQECRDCGEPFAAYRATAEPTGEDAGWADRCPTCVAESLGEEGDDAS